LAEFWSGSDRRAPAVALVVLLGQQCRRVTATERTPALETRLAADPAPINLERLDAPQTPRACGRTEREAQLDVAAEQVAIGREPCNRGLRIG
jgi:hypothetical protein